MSYYIRQLTRQVIHSFSGDTNLIPFHLWWREFVLKCEKNRKYFVKDCICTTVINKLKFFIAWSTISDFMSIPWISFNWIKCLYAQKMKLSIKHFFRKCGHLFHKLPLHFNAKRIKIYGNISTKLWNLVNIPRSQKIASVGPFAWEASCDSDFFSKKFW